MSRAWDIPNWNNGRLIKRDSFKEVWRFNGGSWDCIRDDGTFAERFKDAPPMLHATDWQPFTKPAKTRKVKMYAPILSENGDFVTAYYRDKKEHLCSKVFGWHEIEVEVED